MLSSGSGWVFLAFLAATVREKILPVPCVGSLGLHENTSGKEDEEKEEACGPEVRWGIRSTTSERTAT